MHLSEIGTESGGLCHRFLRPFTASLERVYFRTPVASAYLAPPRPKVYIPTEAAGRVSPSPIYTLRSCSYHDVRTWP